MTRPSQAKLWLFEGEMLPLVAIGERCPAWSKKYVGDAVRKGARTIADISAMWEAGMARKMANCRKPAPPQARILVAIGAGGNSLPNYEYRMLAR